MPKKLKIAECIEAPMSRHGLEGYCLGDSYPFEKVYTPGEGTFYMVYPSADTHPDYCETCGPKVFLRYFRPRRGDRQGIKVDDFIEILTEPKGSINREGRVVEVTSEFVYVTNLNMPFIGTLCREPIRREHIRVIRKKED